MSAIAVSHVAEVPYPSQSCASAASNRDSTDACAAVNFASISPSDRSTGPHAAASSSSAARAVEVVQAGVHHPQRIGDLRHAVFPVHIWTTSSRCCRWLTHRPRRSCGLLFSIAQVF